MSPIELFEDIVAVSPSGGSGTSPGGIVLPENAIEKPHKGMVIAVGPGKSKEDGSRWPMPVKPGDIVIYGRFSGIDLKIGEAMLTFMKATDLFGRLES